MAITTSAITSSFKNELLSGTHNFDAVGGNTFKLALYTDSAVIGPSLASFTTAGQVTDSTGDYSSGGKALTGQTHKLSGTTAIVDFADLSYLTATITAMGALIYNTNQANKSVAVLDFVSNKTSTSGTFTIQFPNFTDTLAIIRLA
tara:strand:+ start:1492 stop:1929 length:438 start_codon:yes stop_codon:yes gene_type:complete